MSAGTRTDYSNYYKQYLKENHAASKYLSALNIASAGYAAQNSALETQTHKNISSAYANHLQQAMMLKHADNLATGSKAHLLEQSKFDTDKTIKAYENNLEASKLALAQERNSGINSIYNQYAQDVASAADAYAERMHQIDRDITELMYAKRGEAYDDLFETDADGKLLGLSRKASEMFYDADGKLTDAGKAWYSEGLYNYDATAKYKLSSEDYDSYVNDRFAINEMLTGEKLNPYDPTKTDLDETLRNSSFKHDFTLGSLKGLANDYFGNAGDSDDVGKLFDIDWSLNTKEEGYTPNNKTLLGNMISDNSPDHWESSEDIQTGQSTFKLKEGSETYDNYIKFVKGLQKLKDSKKFKKGDIVEYDGYLAYYNGETFKLAKDTSELRSKLGSK